MRGMRCRSCEQSYSRVVSALWGENVSTIGLLFHGERALPHGRESRLTAQSKEEIRMPVELTYMRTSGLRVLLVEDNEILGRPCATISPPPITPSTG